MRRALFVHWRQGHNFNQAPQLPWVTCNARVSTCFPLCGNGARNHSMPHSMLMLHASLLMKADGVTPTACC